jgi:hypothetical protein
VNLDRLVALVQPCNMADTHDGYLSLEMTCRLDGYTPDGDRVHRVIERGFNAINRIFDHPDLMEKAIALFYAGKRAPQSSEAALAIRSALRGGSAPHVVLNENAIGKRIQIATLLVEALERDLTADYGGAAIGAVIVEARLQQIEEATAALVVLTDAARVIAAHRREPEVPA